MAEIPDADTNQHEEDNHIIFSVEKRRIYIFREINRDATLEMQSLLDEFRENDVAKKNDRPVTLILNTDGGAAFQGLAIYDLLKSSGLKLITIALGEVASAGVVIFLAGDQRWMHKNAAIHFHSTALQFEKPQERLERFERDILQAEIRVIDDLYKKIYLSNSNLTAKKLRELELTETCLTSDQALKLGLVHKIIG
ncbi:MAG: ATP-dependent Clp protease proteolytic subunit [Candidatus Yanofskybacteria bacterium]|nr:ATP-dependent Clp protease proteolytic subunit [Candidatus Yanofskybacteria bacterium]